MAESKERPSEQFGTGQLVSIASLRTDWKHVSWLARELADDFPRQAPESIKPLQRDIDEFKRCCKTLGIPAPIWFTKDADGDTWIEGDPILVYFRCLIEDSADWPAIRRLVRETLTLFIEKRAPIETQNQQAPIVVNVQSGTVTINGDVKKNVAAEVCQVVDTLLKAKGNPLRWSDLKDQCPTLGESQHREMKKVRKLLGEYLKSDNKGYRLIF